MANGKEKAAEDIMQAIKSTYALDAKTIELISISVSAAMRCSHCLKMHIRSALNLGVPDDQIAAAVFLAGNIVNASVGHCIPPA